MDEVTVRFEPEGVEVAVAPGTTLHAAASEAGVAIEAPCGGLGRCGSCRVRAHGGLRAPGPTEREALPPATLAAGFRLACLAKVSGPDPVRVERLAPRAAPSGASEARSAAGAAPGRTGLGLAVDVGTTTIAAALADLATGEVLGSASALNPQVTFGHDVLSRVSRALAGDAPGLRGSISAALDGLTAEAAAAGGVSPADIAEVVVVGNPAMVHLLLGLDTSPLAAAPYAGARTEAFELAASDAGLSEPARARVFVGPAVSAFVGADLVAGLLVSGIAGREYPALLADLGTNGEIVLWTGESLLATSAAAGPALEGYSISSGMRAEPGAIERVTYSRGELGFATVGGAAPRGVCGSGLLDAVAAMRDAGVLDPSGRLRAEGPLASRVTESDGVLRFELADGVALTQHDVRAVQLAKGAVAAAIGLLLEEARLSPEQVREVMIAGGFGSHVSPRSLVRLRVLPPEWEDRVTFRGNTALEGALAMLADPARREAAVELASRARTVDLATHPEFQRRFLAALAL